jgi:hypothetical protein
MNWVCPHCQKPQVVTDPKWWLNFDVIKIRDNALGDVGIQTVAIGCANVECNQLTITVHLRPVSRDFPGNVLQVQDKEPILSRRLMPAGNAKPQPSYIPAAIREDYTEACQILELSPKASATLSRRCLQGMIRDFIQIVGKTLNQEIIELKKRVEANGAPQGVSEESVTAIDHVRTIGNIGAHMEADVEHIISVEPDEARLLVELIESLFEEWYVERHVRKKRFEDLANIAAAKKLAKTNQAALPAP